MFGQSIFATESQKIQAVQHEKAETALHSVPLKRIVLQISSKLCNFDCERGGKNLKDCDCFMHLFFLNKWGKNPPFLSLVLQVSTTADMVNKHSFTFFH